MTVRRDLLEILACPKCKGPVRAADDGTAVLCDGCRLRYPVVDDIPVMLISEATPLEAGEQT